MRVFAKILILNHKILLVIKIASEIYDMKLTYVSISFDSKA